MPATRFERFIASNNRWSTLQEADGTILGYYRSSGGYEEIRDRDGTIVWSDEIGLEQPLISPIDLIGPAAVRSGVRASVLLTSRIIAKITARTASRSIAGGSTRVLIRLRTTAQRIAARLSGQNAMRGIAQQAQAMVASIRQAGRKVIVNLGGTGEVSGAININPLRDQQIRAIPNLIRASAERIGSIFRSGSVDKIVSNDIVRGQVNWTKAAQGAFRILRPRGQVSIAPYAGGLQQHLMEISSALRAAGFHNIKTVGGRFITAIRP